MSGTTANLNNNPSQVDTSLDSVVIVANLETIVGGKTLDTTGYADEYIKAGHLVIEETANGKLKPMPVTNATTYASLPANHTYKGVVSATVLTAKPFVSVMVRGTVNDLAGARPALSGAVTDLPLIRFTKD